jgi:hypothetical protein
MPYWPVLWLAQQARISDGELSAELLKGPRGSGLESVVLRPGMFYDDDGPWVGLEANVQSIHLRFLHMAIKQGPEFAALLRHLPNLLYLQELEFQFLYQT